MLTWGLACAIIRSQRRTSAMSDNVTYTFDMDAKLYSQIKDMAEEEHRTIAGQIRMILDDYIEKVSEKARRKNDK